METMKERIINLLNSQLDIKAYGEQPAQPPKEYFVVEQVGSFENGLLCDQTFSIRSNAETLYRAGQLNSILKNTLRKARKLDSRIVNVEITNDYEDTDYTTKQYRYNAFFRVYYIRKEQC